MDVKFIMNAEIRIDNVVVKHSAKDIAKKLEYLFADAGITANIEVSGLTYINEVEE